MSVVEAVGKAQKPAENGVKSVSKSEVKNNITDNESCKMTTSKGTIQGYNGIAAADAAHQVIIDAKAYGDGQEHHTLIPTLLAIEERYR